MNDRTLLASVAILALTILESVALFKDYDGFLFQMVTMMISGLGGFAAGYQLMIRKVEKEGPKCAECGKKLE